jgi:hypothetical protein
MVSNPNKFSNPGSQPNSEIEKLSEKILPEEVKEIAS